MTKPYKALAAKREYSDLHVLKLGRRSMARNMILGVVFAMCLIVVMEAQASAQSVEVGASQGGRNPVLFKYTASGSDTLIVYWQQGTVGSGGT
jgi:hypothetical protein